MNDISKNKVFWALVAAIVLFLFAPFIVFWPAGSANDVAWAAWSAWAAWAQAIGTIAAVGVAILVSNWQYKNQKGIERNRLDAEVRHMLIALRDEAAVLLELMLGRYGDKVANYQQGQPINSIYPVDNDVFQIFDGYKGHIGKISDPDARQKIVFAYAHARSLVYSINMNNMLVREHQQAKEIAFQNRNDATVAIMNAKYFLLVDYANVLKSSWDRSRNSASEMIKSIEAAIQKLND